MYCGRIRGGPLASWGQLVVLTRVSPTTMSRELLNPIPQELDAVSGKAAFANTIAVDTVQLTIERLERARQQLVSGEHPDQLLALSSFLKTSNSKVATAHKDWSLAVTMFGKTVDKVRRVPVVDREDRPLILALAACCRSSRRRSSLSSRRHRHPSQPSQRVPSRTSSPSRPTARRAAAARHSSPRLRASGQRPLSLH